MHILQSTQESDTSEQIYTTKQARELLNLSRADMQYYFRYGLIPYVRRTRTGRATLTQTQIEWLQALVYFRRCGFKLPELRHYRKLSCKGIDTLAERKAMIETKRQQLMREADELYRCVDFLNEKQQYFDQILSQQVEYPEKWI